MKLPLDYALRNLMRRPFRSAMTTFGLGVVIFAGTLMMGLSLGIYQRIDVTGEPQNLLLISKKGTNMMMSNLDEDEIISLAELPNIQYSVTGELLISSEVYDICYLSHAQISSEPQSLYVRGVRSIGYEVHHDISVIKGRLPENPREIMVGRSAWVKLGVPESAMAIDSKLRIERDEWTICGIFSARGSVLESEVWCDLDELMEVRRRRTPSSVFIRFNDVAALKNSLPSFSETGVFSRYFKATPEKDYYRESAGAVYWIYGLSLLMSGAVVLVGLLIGVNTMYANIMNRRKEIATYQVMGFSRFDIFCTFLSESLMMTAIGGAIGLIGVSFADGFPLSTGQGAFFIMVDWRIIGIGILLITVMGVLGALLPIVNVLSRSALNNLRSA